MQHANKGKPINTSVPSIAIRFHANAEELEELYQSEEESVDKSNNDKSKCTENVGDPEGSPLRSYLPRIGKRSTSIDTSFTAQDSSPPSDPWKFFHEIKGKITKSVEDTITEIKQRNQEGEGSAKKSKLAKDKDNSSLSDSEDMSESSISKTCGAISTTTEGVEMSSDDDTPSLEKDKKSAETLKSESSTTIKSAEKQRFRIIKKKKPSKEGNIALSTLANIYEINTGLKASISEEKRLTSNDNVEEVESGVEALEDINLQQAQNNGDDESELLFPPSEINLIHRASTEDVISTIADTVDNVKFDDDKVLNIEQVCGTDIRDSLVIEGKSHTYLAPEGFVDLRQEVSELSWFDIIYSCRYVVVIVGVIFFYFYLSIPVYVSGFIAGSLFTSALIGVYNKLYSLNTKTTGLTADPPFSIPSYSSQSILEVPAAKEYQPIAKFEGWMNEYPDEYNPETYQLTHTQSVYIRVQGNLLKISHPRVKIPKRAVWNEAKHKLLFSHHRIYNLLGAKISLLPEGLVKKRHWSKKYPICITLNKDQLNFDYWQQSDSLKTTVGSMTPAASRKASIHSDISGASGLSENVKTKSEASTRSKRIFGSKKKYAAPAQLFSKLTEEDDFILESESSRPSTPSPAEEDPSLDISESNIKLTDEEVTDLLKDTFDQDEDQMEDDMLSISDWGTFTPEPESPTETHIYLFARSDREKEDWYRWLVMATHRGAHLVQIDNTSIASDTSAAVSDTLINSAKNETEYLKYMAKLQKKKVLENPTPQDVEQTASVLWINALIGRVLFDCTRDESFRKKVQDRIQRKLSTLKMPMFVERLIISELSLGSTPPVIHKASSPVLDQRGLWIDLDVTYEGVVVLTLLTKLNLMKLRHPPSADINLQHNRAAKWQNSDVDDTAESSTDDDNVRFVPPTGKLLEEGGATPALSVGGTSNKGKKFIKMVDKIAESKFFQAATENRLIKKAMEGVSNTDFGLKVELKGLAGTLVLNVPPPPSDRIWLGFRPTPKLWLTAQPIVGERNISFFGQVTSIIEKKLSQEFQKVLVIPNMEDILIPVMSPKLPE